MKLQQKLVTLLAASAIAASPACLAYSVEEIKLCFSRFDISEVKQKFAHVDGFSKFTDDELYQIIRGYDSPGTKVFLEGKSKQQQELGKEIIAEAKAHSFTGYRLLPKEEQELLIKHYLGKPVPKETLAKIEANLVKIQKTAIEEVRNSNEKREAYDLIVCAWCGMG